MSRRRHSAAKRPLSPRFHVELLEDRTSPDATPANVFAVFPGVLAAGATRDIPVVVRTTPNDFTLAGGTILAGVHVRGVGNGFDPDVAVVTQGGNVVTPLFQNANLVGGGDSLTVVDLAGTNYTIQVRGQRGTSGAYQVEVFLAGDADGNGTVNAADGTLIRNAFGVRSPDPRYNAAYDSNRDGIIEAFDLAQQRRNVGDATQVRPLTATVSIANDPVVLGDGRLLTNVAASAVVGTATSTGIAAALETGPDDNFDNGSATGDASGAFRIATTLAEGDNPFRLRVRDGFGQEIVVGRTAALDTVAPTATLSFNGLSPAGERTGPVAELDVTFDEAMGSGAFNKDNYTVRVTAGVGVGGTIAPASATRLSDAAVRLTFAPPLPDGQSYEIVFAAAATDLARNATAPPRTLAFTANESFAVASVTPADGEEGVSVVRPVVVNFSEEIDPVTLASDAVQVLSLGNFMPGRLAVSATKKFVTFYPTDPFPAATEIRVVVDGGKVRSLADGHFLDADGDGVAGGVRNADFRTLPLTRILGTHVFGYVYDSYNKNPDGSDRPIVGATIRVDDFPEANAITDADGYFELRDMPAPGFFVHIDGTTAVNAPAGTGYPSVGKEFHSVPGQRTQLNMGGVPFHIYLPPMAFGDIVTLSPTAPTNVGFGAAGLAELQTMFPGVLPSVWQKVQVTYAPNSAQDREGRPATQAVVIPVPPDRLPAPLPPGQNPQLVISIQAPGATTFDVPAPITFPNLDNLPLGDRPAIFSFNHDAGRWDPIGTGTVVEDGQGGTIVVSDPGSGIRSPGWHYVSPPQNWTGSTGKPGGNKPANMTTPPEVTVKLFATGDTDTLSYTFTPPPGSGQSPGQHSGKKQPKRHVEITFTAEFETIYKNEGANKFVKKTFDLKPGDAPVTMSANLRSLTELLAKVNGGKPLDKDRLYGAKLTIKETLTLADGSTFKSSRILVPYLYVDQSDDSGDDKLLKFRDAAEPDPINSLRDFDRKTSGAPTPTLQFMGAAAGDYSVDNSGTALVFNPSAVGDRSANLKLTVTVEGQAREATGPSVKGKGTGVTTIYLDKTSFIAQMQALGGLTNAQAVALYPQFKQHFQDLIDDLMGSANKAAVLSDAAPGTASPRIEIAWKPGAAGSSVDGRAVSGVDFDTAGFRDNFVPQAKRDKLGKAQQVFLMDSYFNNNAVGQLEMYVDKLLLTADYLGDINAHEGGHTLGLVHTDWMNLPVQSDIMLSNGDPTVWNKATRMAALMALNAVARTVDVFDTTIPAYLKAWTNRPNPAQNNPFPHQEDVPVEPILSVRNPDQGVGYSFDIDLGQVVADGAGGQKNTVTALVTNDGGADLVLTSVALANAGGPFTISGFTPGTTLAPQASILLQLSFDPIGFGGFSNTLVFTTNTPGPEATPGIHPFQLLGVGLSPNPVLGLALGNGGNNNFGGVNLGSTTTLADFFTVTNTGGADLTFTATVAAGAADFDLGAFTGVPQTLHPGESLVLPVTFHPSALGLRPGSIQFVTNDPTRPTVAQALVGSGVPVGDVGDADYTWSNAYVLVQAGPVSSNLRSDAQGNFQVGVGINASYQLTVFDPRSGYVATSSGISGPSGAFTDITSALVFQASTAPDGDGDGLPDDIERAIGTALNRADTDGDGLSDFAEIQNNLNPVDGIGYPTGVIATLPVQGSAEKVVADGNTLYVATGSFGLAVVDGSQFNNPILLGQLDLPGTATGVGVDGNLKLAAVATGSALQIVDVSEGMTPRLARTVAVPATHVEVANGLAYAASNGSLRVVDLASGNVVQTLTIPGSGTLTGFAREGTKLYAYMSGSDTLSVLDIANEGSAVVRGQLTVSIASFDVGLFAGNNTVWLAGSGLTTVNVSNPAAPSLIHGADFQFTARRVALNGSGLGVLLPDGGNFLQLYDTSDPTKTNQFVAQFGLSGTARDVAVSRGIAYVAVGGRLEVVNYRAFDNLGAAPTVGISTPAADQDPTRPGLQVLEGTTLPIAVNASDDVQVSKVELLVNGTVVRGDVSFPFDFFALAPSIAQSGSFFTLQVRATDTGGNVGLSNLLTVGLTRDTFAPTVVSFAPPTNASQIEPLQSVQVRFSEPMATATVTAATVRLRDAAGSVLTPTNFQLRDDDRLVQLTFAPLVAGTYQIVVSGSVTDRAGNVLGAQDVSSGFTLTPRATLATTAADVDAAAPGLQVFEGTTLPLTVTVQAGVAVQRVDLLVNGAVVGTDTTAPYSFSVLAPNITPSLNSLTLAARVTDTGGLTTMSNEILVGLRDDIVPPTITSTDPSNGSTRRLGLTEVRVRFSEGLAAATVTTANFTLVEAGPGGVFGDGNDVPVTVTQLLLSEGDATVQVQTNPLPIGVYRLSVDRAGVTDRAGNAVGVGTFASSFTLTEGRPLTGVVGYIDDREGGTGNEQTIARLNRTPLRLFDSNLATNNLSGIDVLILGLGNGGRNATLLANIAVINNFVADGGTLILHDSNPGANAAQDVVPGLNTSTFVGLVTSANVDVIDATSRLVTGPFGTVTNATLDGGNASTHGYVVRSTLPAEVKPVLSTGGDPNRVAALTYPFGNGHVIYTTFPAEFYLQGFGNATFRQNLVNIYLPNELSLALDQVATGPGGIPYLRAETVAASATAPPLTEATARPVIDAALAFWAEVLGTAPAAVAVAVADLPGDLLGQADPQTGRLTLDVNAAGVGWFVDATPFANEEFGAGLAFLGSPASGRYDLLTAALHEIGHLLGFNHVGTQDHPGDVMNESLSVGERRLPRSRDVVLTDLGGVPAVAEVRAAPDDSGLVHLAVALPAGTLRPFAEAPTSARREEAVVTPPTPPTFLTAEEATTPTLPIVDRRGPRAAHSDDLDALFVVDAWKEKEL